VKLAFVASLLSLLACSVPALAFSDNFPADDDRDAMIGSTSAIVPVALFDTSDASVDAGAPITFRASVSVHGLTLVAQVTWRVDGTTTSCVSDLNVGEAITCVTRASLAPGTYTTTILSDSLEPNVTFVGAAHGVLIVTLAPAHSSVGAINLK
jgi:hypothetical protein